MSRAMVVDWASPAMTDCLWGRLLTLEWLARYAELGYECPTCMWASVANVCHATRAPSTVLYRLVERPYLSQVEDPTERCRAIRSEFGLRRYFEDMQNMASILKMDVVCAGGFPSWRLERHEETRRGGDALPRSIRETTIGSCRDIQPYWVPRSLDVYTSEDDPDLVMLMLGDAYVRYVRTVFGTNGGHTCAFVSEPLDAPGNLAVDPHEDREHELKMCLEHIDKHFPASHTVRSSVRRHIQLSASCPRTPGTVRRMCTCVSPLQMAFEPSSVTVWHVQRAGTDRRLLSDLLPCLLPLSNASIQISLSGGHWHYRGTLQSLADLATRSIRITNTHSYAQLLVSLHWYLMRGFNLTNDPPSAGEHSRAVTVMETTQLAPPPPVVSALVRTIAS